MALEGNRGCVVAGKDYVGVGEVGKDDSQGFVHLFDHFLLLLEVAVVTGVVCCFDMEEDEVMGFDVFQYCLGLCH